MARSGAGTSLLLLLLGCATCKRENPHVNDTDDRSSMGRLTPGCVEKYYNMYVSRSVPKRRYRYHHEQKEFLDNRRRHEGTVDVQWRIVGGQQVDISQSPYTVLYGPYCGGCLIAPDWVITAAHCRTVDDFIIAGSTKASDGTRYHVCAHFLHPEWENPKKLHFHDYDYQLLLLETPVPVSARARPIAIGDVRDVVPGAMVSVTGWGHTQEKQKNMQNILRQVSVPIIPFKECKALRHKYYANITPRMFCAGFFNGTRDSCQGDSGGPAVLNDKLVGLVSFGVGCAEREKPGVYSIVPLARPWIREVTGLPL